MTSMSVNTGYEIKTDCMFYEHKRKNCIALKELFCKEENCKFYTNAKEVNNSEKNEMKQI